jgi:hypothetical protein
MSGLTDELAWLEQWYQEQCDGDWEHHCGVTIETLDNPGWLVQADLRARPAIATDRALAIVGGPAQRHERQPRGSHLDDLRHQSGKVRRCW